MKIPSPRPGIITRHHLATLLASVCGGARRRIPVWRAAAEHHFGAPGKDDDERAFFFHLLRMATKEGEAKVILAARCGFYIINVCK